MTGFLPDTSVLIAALCTWHEQHAAAARELESRLARGEQMVLAAPSLVETYAVLTRLPPPYRLAPKDAHALLQRNFLTGRKTVSLDGPATRDLLKQLAEAEIAGGQSYDGVIAACARRGKVKTLLTFNESHFEVLIGKDLRLVVPGR